MSDAHEEFLAELLGGRRARGSGNQFNDQMDGRNRADVPFALAWDGKSTLGNSVGVSASMWDKAKEQAGGEIPMLALRWYGDTRLTPTRDLVVLDAHDFAAILETARLSERLKECADSGHTTTAGSNDCTNCGRAVGYIED